MKSIKASDKISLAECRKILKQNDLTDEQIIAVRDWLYFIGEVMIEQTENLNPKTNGDEKFKSGYL